MSNIWIDPRIRLFVNDTWEDVTSKVRVGNGIEYFTGSQDESKDPNPGWCKFTFDNTDGDFTPRNPMSPYAGYLNVNTPMCLLLDEITDDFERTSVDSWGSADTGEPYTNTGTGGMVAADFQVASGVATHRVTAGASFRMSYFASTSGAPSVRNVVQKVRFTLPFSDVTGGAIEPGNLLCRIFDVNNYYMCRLVINTDESVSLAIYRGSSVVIAGPVTVPGITHQSGQGIWVMFGAFDDDLYATAWVGDDREDEPTDWLITVNDTNPFLEFGRYGIRTGVATGNTNLPITVSYDNYSVWLGQFAGEIPDFPQEFSDDGADKIVPVEAAGIMRRLGEGKGNTFLSTPRRFFERFSTEPPDWYWPLDDGELSLSARATVRPAGFDPNDVGYHYEHTALSNPDSANEKRFGQYKLAPWLPNCARIIPDATGTTFLIAYFPDGSADIPNDNWTIDWAYSGGSKQISTFILAGYLDPGVTVGAPPLNLDQFIIWFDASLQEIEVFPGRGEPSTVIDTTTLSVNPFDGRMHHIRFRVNVQSGVDLHWTLHIDGNAISSGTETSHPFMAKMGVMYWQRTDAEDAKDVGIAHVAMYLTNDPAGNAAQTSYIYNGWHDAARFGLGDNETAKDRFSRLCEEEGIPEFTSGSGGREMGPQYPDNIMDQLFEIARTDGGLVRELLSGAGLHYDTLSELRAKTTTLTIDVSAFELGPGFKPVDDTQQLRNKVRAIKRDGGDYTYEKTDGRLGTASPKEGGSGVYSGGDIKANPFLESALIAIAQRVVAQGTVDKARFPEIMVNMRATSITSNLDLRRDMLAMFVSSRLTLTGMESSHIYENSDLMVIGMTRRMTNHEMTIKWNTIPFESFDVFRVETAGSILGTDSSTVVYAIDDNDTSIRVSTEGKSLWTTNAGSLPITARIGIPPTGEDVSITNITTTASGFRSVGTASHGDNATTTPGLPAGQLAGDTLVLVTAIRNTSAVANNPTGWTVKQGSGHLLVCTKTSVGAGESVPNCTYSGGAAGDSTSSFIMSFTNMPVDFTNAVTIAGADNPSAQNITLPALTLPRSNGLELILAWKRDDYTSIAVPDGFTEIAEYFTTTGNDQGLYAAYRVVAVRDESPIQTLVVTGGAAAVSKGFRIHFSNPQTMIITRSVNNVVKSWSVDTQIRIAYPKPLG